MKITVTLTKTADGVFAIRHDDCGWSHTYVSDDREEQTATVEEHLASCDQPASRYHTRWLAAALAVGGIDVMTQILGPGWDFIHGLLLVGLTVCVVQYGHWRGYLHARADARSTGTWDE